MDPEDLGRRVELLHGSLLEPVAGRRFDLVVSNPPFVITPRTEGEETRYVYRDGARGRHLMEEHQQSGECHGGDCGGGEGLALGGHPGGDRAAGSGSGSGIILDDQGHVLTNTHVVTLGGQTNNPEISVRMDDGSVTSAEVVGTDPLSDLAVVQLEDAEGLTPAELGSSGELNVGDRTIAIGAPLGLEGTVTDGIVSTLNRTISVASADAGEEETEEVPEEPEDGGDDPEASSSSSLTSRRPRATSTSTSSRPTLRSTRATPAEL